MSTGPRRESILELAKLMDSLVRVKCLGGRELQDPDDAERITNECRRLGLVVVRGTQVSLVSPQDGVEEIANPFVAADGE